jgi:hypothetical protein
MLPLTVAISYLLSLTVNYYLPQVIAILSIVTIISFWKKITPFYPISLIINLIVFSTHGLSSPFFFLIYFLLFVVAFRYKPNESLFLTLTIIIFLAQSLNSYISLIPLISLLFITPLVWLVSRQSQTISLEETQFLLWLNLKFKTGASVILDLSSQLQSSPLNYSQKEQVKKIRSSIKNLLNSAEKLTKEISDDE